MPPAIVPAAEPLVARPAPSSTVPPAPAAVRGADAGRRPPLSPETLHPALWRGHQLGRSADSVLASGFPELDAQLPGGGWPRRALSELLLPHLGIGEIRLLAPVLCEVQRAGRLVMLFDPPALLSGWALSQLGLDVEQLLLIQSAPQVPVDPGRATPGPSRAVGGLARLWALEQALKSGHVGAVLAWLPPRLSPDRVRRLQLAAHAHDGPAFVLREMAAQPQPSASPLRLGLRAAGIDQLAISVLKRRGPPLLQPVHLRLPAMLPVSVPMGGVEAVPSLPGEGGPAAVPVGLPAEVPAGGADGAVADADADAAQAAQAEQVPQSAAGRAVAPRLPTATFINLA